MKTIEQVLELIEKAISLNLKVLEGLGSLGDRMKDDKFCVQVYSELNCLDQLKFFITEEPQS